MERTTVYFPHDLKEGITREAARRGTSEAEVIREAVRQLVGETERPRPRGGFIDTGEPIDTTRLDDYLAGFGGS